MTTFDRILIANNGMAAAKFLISMHSHFQSTKDARPIHFCGMVSPDDLKSGASYISKLDSIVLVPSGPSSANYGNVDLIVELAKEHSCGAVWPGWGHASENFLLAQKLEVAGIVWIGPSWQCMQRLGDKVESLLQAQRCGVPCAPWSGSAAVCASDSGIYSEEQAVLVCEQIGYPVMLKASNGGGGKGIRRINSKAESVSCYRQVRAEVSEGIIFAMKCLENCRHVEVQILGNGKGQCISLATRDCSVQRRHQKLIEEGPAPFIPPTVLHAMEEAAERLCASVSYGNAGTVEFLYRSDEFFFLEVNCRLQVEHPVTELLWGINLPALQLGLALEIVELDTILGSRKHAHVVGCRIVAEDPSNNWMPSSGDIESLTLPPVGEACRFEYFSVGNGIHQYSDSQFGHVFFAADSREIALGQLAHFLDRFTLVGSVANNAAFMATVVRGSSFAAGPPATSWLDQTRVKHVRADCWLSLVAVSAHLAMDAYRSAETESLRWIRRGHRAPHVPASYTETLVCPSGERVGVLATRTAPTRVRVELASLTATRRVDVEWIVAAGNSAVMILPPNMAGVLASVVPTAKGKLKAQVGQGWHQYEVLEDTSRVSAPMNGRLVRWLISENDFVLRGSPLCEIEAMKMVSQVCARISGSVHFKVQEGVSFIEGDWLATIEDSEHHVDPLASPQSFVGSILDKISVQPLNSAEIAFVLRNKLDGFAEDLENFDLDIATAESLLALFVRDEQECLRWIDGEFSNVASATDYELVTVWRHRLNLNARMETVGQLLARFPELKDQVLPHLDSQQHANLFPSVNPVEDGACLANTFYIYDLPGMIAKAVEGEVFCEQIFARDFRVGMVAWLVTITTGSIVREVVFIGNDITFQAGSFALEEDQVYLEASALARARGIPRVFIACNSGARLGLCESVQSLFRVQWKQNDNPSLGAEYLYLIDSDYQRLKDSVVASPREHSCEGKIWVISDLLGGSGVENLMGSGAIAGESSKAYEEIVTLTYVTGRTVGIGAYIARLCQRIIQKESAPILLTGYQALNKLIGANVYHSNDEIGGPGVMFRNGVSHLTVKTDQEGIDRIMEWIAFLPPKKGTPLPILSEPISLEVHADWESLFDLHSFVEVQSGWAQSVIVGRARLGGVPIGVIVVQTRQTQFFQPADPADPHSQSVARPQAGQVWYPDSAYKTAQAIEDFNHEELPLMILANWRGFSGGQRDMFNEILKFGSFIVDALRVYTRPVFVYLPPKAELRGGAWVVIDARINPEQIEMYADPTARGGVLEPSGTIEIKFRDKALFALMLRSDGVAQIISHMEDSKAKLQARFEQLKPTLKQIASNFADMHDTPTRMLHIGAIRGIVPWENSRAFFCKRLRERLSQE